MNLLAFELERWLAHIFMRTPIPDISLSMYFKRFLLAAVILATCCVFVPAAETANVETQLQELVEKIREKLQQGKTTKDELAENLKEFDVLLEQHKGEKTDEVAQVLVAQASLYLQVFEDTETGLRLFRKLKSEFPETTQGKMADQIIASIEVQQNLVIGAQFPVFEDVDLLGKPISIAKFKDKVVLLDFWATWCGPCISELPNVTATYEEFHSKGFEIIGISLDREEETLRAFLKRRSLPWNHIFDEEGKLAGRYSVASIPTTYLLDGNGKILAKNLRGPALRAEVAKLLDK